MSVPKLMQTPAQWKEQYSPEDQHDDDKGLDDAIACPVARKVVGDCHDCHVIVKLVLGLGQKEPTVGKDSPARRRLIITILTLLSKLLRTQAYD